ncbi:5559_t:CDS:2 [Ambispora gerdemannii]|uniref:5559_t:CDS:1 n=1 Tax=Ambispora gerdemannii TaxID=144530 RepID=A0A9N8Z5L9_9GLOM|nr:5559_t:CDS:2 [Ambispora gerdemannii]
MNKAFGNFFVHNEITNHKSNEDSEWSEFSTWDNTTNDVEFTNVWQEFDQQEPEEKPKRTTISSTGVLRDVAENAWSEVEIVASPTSTVSPKSPFSVKDNLGENEKVLNESIQEAEIKNSKKISSLLTPPTSPPISGTEVIDPEDDDNDFGDFISQSSGKDINTPNDSDHDNDENVNDEEFGDFEFGQENNDTDDLQDTLNNIDVSSIDHSKFPQEVTHWIEFLDQIYPSNASASDSQNLPKSILLKDLVNNANEYLNSEITLSSLVEPMINDDGIVRVTWRGSQTQKVYFENIFGFKESKKDTTPIETTPNDATPATVPIIPIYSKIMNETMTAVSTAEPRKSINESRRESSIESRRDSLLSIPELALSSTSTSPPTSPISPMSPCNSQPLHELAGLKFFNDSKPDRNQLFDAHYLKHLYHSSNNAGKGSQTSELADLITQDTTKSKALQDLQELTVALVSEIVSSPEGSKKSSMKWNKSKFSSPIQPVPAKLSDNSLNTQSKSRHKGLVIDTKRDQPQKNENSLNMMFPSDEFGDLVSADTTKSEFFDSAESNFSSQSSSLSFEIMRPTIPSKAQNKPITTSKPTEIAQNTRLEVFTGIQKPQEKNSVLDFGERSSETSQRTKSNFVNDSIKNSLPTTSSHSHQSSASSLFPRTSAHSLFSTKNSAFKDFQELTAVLKSEVVTDPNSISSSSPINQTTSKSNNSEMTSQINANSTPSSQSNSWFSTTDFSCFDSVKSQHIDDFGALNSTPETTII